MRGAVGHSGGAALHAACLVLLALACAAAAAQKVCTVDDGAGQHQPVSLADCLRDQDVTEVVVKGHHVGASFEQYHAAPLPVRRNVTIRGPAANTAPDDWPELDLNWARGVVEVCGSCTLKLQQLVILHDRRGTGPVYDFFTGQPGSRVLSTQVYRLRNACTPGVMQLKVMQGLRRSALFPNSTLPQQTELRNVTYKGKVYHDAVWSSDVSFDVPFKIEEGGGTEGGVAQGHKGTTRLCKAYVAQDCLSSRTSADQCVIAMLDSLQAAAKPAGVSQATAVAIGLGVAVGFLLTAAGIFVWWVVRRRRMRRAAAAASRHHKLAHGKSRHAGAGTPSRHTCSTGGTLDTDSDETGGSAGGPCLGKPLATSAAWELVDSRTSPLLGAPVEDNTVELGSLIGAGSFGKVFRARWNGMDVAVKVIEHTGTSSAAVDNEMEMMMSFNHQNIVRAFHFLTYVHRDGPASEYSTSTNLSRHGSGALGSSFTHAKVLSSSGSFSVAKLGLSTQTSTSFNSSGGALTAAVAAAAAAAAAGGPAASTTLARQSSRAAAVAAGACASCGGATVLTITEDAAMRDTQPCCCGAGAGHAAAQQADTQSSMLAAGQQGAAASLAASNVWGSVTAAGSASAAAGVGAGGSKLQQGLTDSLGSSVDCRCVAGVVPAELRSAKSFKEPARRFESWLVLEHCDRGNLNQYLAQWPAPGQSLCADTMIQLLQLLQDTARGLQELHAKHVVHGDLNARNVLVASSSDRPGGVTAKLADLGLSRSIRQHKTHRTTNTVGTLSHVAPEMLRSGQMSVAADVWAMGIMMWELYSGVDAFQGLQHVGQFFETVVLQDLRPVIPHGMPADFQLLMQHCWATEVSARPSITSVLECLTYMLQERQHATTGAAGGAAGGGGQQRMATSAPLPLLLSSLPPRKQHWWQQHHLHRLSLLKLLGSDHGSPHHAGPMTPSQASSGLLPSFAGPGSAPNSNSLLPVLDVEGAANNNNNSQLLPAVPPSVLMQMQQQHPPAAQRDLLPPPGTLSQPLPSGFAGSFSFLPQPAPSSRRSSLDAPPCSSREGSSSHKSASGSSAGRLPTLLQNIRQGSFSLHDLSFSSSRGPSWTARGGSQTNSSLDHPWFV